MSTFDQWASFLVLPIYTWVWVLIYVVFQYVIAYLPKGIVDYISDYISLGIVLIHAISIGIPASYRATLFLTKSYVGFSQKPISTVPKLL